MLEFIPDLGCGEGVQSNMVVGVIGDLMTFAHHVTHKVRVGFGVASHTKEGRFDIGSLENVQEQRGEQGVRGIIEGHRGDGRLGIPVVNQSAWSFVIRWRSELLFLLLTQILFLATEQGNGFRIGARLTDGLVRCTSVDPNSIFLV